ncbi:MAG: hypothetical protein ACREV1_01975 [Gammaproteobacteria bacterium]
MAERPRRGTQRLALDGDWTLFEFSQFARAYSQAYSVLYSLDPTLSPDPEDEEFERIRHLYNAFPWRGGYSAVNFYESLRCRVPKQDRPAIKSIRYESPGWIELSLIVGVALSIKSIIKSFAGSVKQVNSTYHEIYKGMQNRKLTDLDIKRGEIELTREQRRFARESADELAERMHFERLAQLKELSDNEVASLKILLSLFRRSRDLWKIEQQGRIRF